ncbi:hypothetical protein J4480_06165 [Candidatus Woesearchaeota archaeon]|nr:hypothetical protein [Candidatus Woesearchaeota archaeon]
MQKTKFKQTGIGKKDFIGAWRITKMSDFDNDYVNEEVKAFIKVEKSGMGEFHFGLVQGSMSGDFKKNREGIIFDFTWEGNDECDSANGDGWMKINDDGTAEGEIRFHLGDTSKFWAKKAKTR